MTVREMCMLLDATYDGTKKVRDVIERLRKEEGERKVKRVLEVEYYKKLENISSKAKENNGDKCRLLAETICKYCVEKELTMNDVEAAFSIVIDKFLNDAVINAEKRR